MQQCSMNGDVFRRDDDGKLFLNGNEIINDKVSSHKIDAISSILFTLLGFLMGICI